MDKEDLSSMWQGSWIRFWPVTTLFSTMSMIAEWCLLKQIIKHARSIFPYIFEKVF